MDERNVAQGVTATLLSGFVDFLQPLVWLFITAFVLIIADLRFGIQAARVRGEKVRASRAVRRTGNKIVDYLCWIFLAGCFGKSFGDPFGIPILPVIALIVIFGLEINSCYNNYLEGHGKKGKVNIFKYLKSKTDIIEIEDDGNKDNEQ